MTGLEVGSKFPSFKELEAAITKFSHDTNSVYTVFNSKSIEFENRHRPPDKQLPLCLKYRTVKFACKHYGKTRSKSRGLRPNQRSFKIGCPSYISAGVQNNQLIIDKMVTEHTHVCDPDVVNLYPERRSIASDKAKLFTDSNISDDENSEEVLKSVREDVLDLLQMSVDRRRIKNYVQLRTNKILLSTDLANLAKQLQGQERQISEERSFQLLDKLGALESKENSPARVNDDFVKKEKYKLLKRVVPPNSKGQAESSKNITDDNDINTPEHDYTTPNKRVRTAVRTSPRTGANPSLNKNVLAQSQGGHWDPSGLEEMVKNYINPNGEGPVVVHLNNYDGVMVVEVPDGHGSTTQLEGSVVEVSDDNYESWDSKAALQSVLKKLSKPGSVAERVIDQGSSGGKVRVLRFKKKHNQQVIDQQEATGEVCSEAKTHRSNERFRKHETSEPEEQHIDVKDLTGEVEHGEDLESCHGDGDYTDYNNEGMEENTEHYLETADTPTVERCKLEAETKMLKVKTDKLSLQVKYLRNELTKQELEKEKLRLEILLLKARIGVEEVR